MGTHFGHKSFPVSVSLKLLPGDAVLPVLGCGVHAEVIKRFLDVCHMELRECLTLTLRGK